MKVEFVSKTVPAIEDAPTSDDLIAYCARVSNPGNQHNSETAPALLRYLIRNKHWSPFEMVNMCVSIETSRAIAQQILRHRSFSFQEFSQRYAAVDQGMVEPVGLRMQAEKNRQSSSEAAPDYLNSAVEQSGIALICTESYLERGLQPNQPAWSCLCARVPSCT